MIYSRATKFLILKIIVLINFSASINYAEDTKTIYIIKNSWHTEFVLPGNASESIIINGNNIFSGSQFVSFGFGDSAYYQNQNPEIADAIFAAVISTPGIIRAAKINYGLDVLLKYSDFVIKLDITNQEYNNLMNLIKRSLLTDEHTGEALIDNNHSNSIFFLRTPLKYDLFYTCNTWIAELLYKIGLPVSPKFVIRAEDLYLELKEIGTILKD